MIRGRTVPDINRSDEGNGGMQDLTGACAVVATSDGNLAVWPDCSELGSEEPLAAHVAEEVTCIGSCTSADASMSAVLGTKAGKLYLLHCSHGMDEAAPPVLTISELQLAEVATCCHKSHCMSASQLCFSIEHAHSLLLGLS